MIKTRLIPCIYTKNNLVVQSVGFKRYMPIGRIETAVEFFSNWDVDEIIIVDIDATREKRRPNFDLLKRAVSQSFVPVVAGGGIRTIEDIFALLRSGADKVCLNSIVTENENFLKIASDHFGNQCITVSVDVTEVSGEYRVYDYLRGKALEIDLVDYLKKIAHGGAGEILLNSVDRDGSGMGYDIRLLKRASSAVNIPIIALGGVGRVDHLAAAVSEGGCQAAAAANFFQHLEHSVIVAKSQMKRMGLNVRLSSDVKYDGFSLDTIGRLF